MEKTKFSVLISVYYKESPEFFTQSIHSIWHDQSLKPTEIVLVKDGALTTELDRIIETMKEILPLKIVTLPENKGLGMALAEGLAQCTYELVARMDSDDISTPDRFKKQIEYFQKNPDTTILGGQIIEFKNDITNIIGFRNVPIEYNFILKFAKKRSPFNHPSVMYRKSTILNVGSYQDFKFMEDYHLWLRVLNKGYKCANLSDNILYFRMGDDVIGRRQGWLYFKQEYRFAMYAYKLGIINFYNTLINIAIRGIPRLLPKKILKLVYSFIR